MLFSVKPQYESAIGIFAWRIQGERSLLGYSPWDRKELDMSEMTACTYACFSQIAPLLCMVRSGGVQSGGSESNNCSRKEMGKVHIEPVEVRIEKSR